MLPPNRRPIVIADARLSTGQRSTRVHADDPEALLRQYLRLIRRARKQQRERSVALRRVDIAALAEHLEWTNEQVLARLADLMGATRRQRATMLAVMATGASLITIAAPASASSTLAPAASPGAPRHEAPVVVVAEHLASSDRASAASEHAGRLTRPDADAPTGRQAPVLAAQSRRAVPPAPSLYVGRSMAAPEPPQSHDDASSEQPPTDAAHGAADETGHDEHGNLVATGQPPTPPPTPATTVADPIPTVDTVDTGNDVDVSETGHDEHGNLVATGQPPIPPAQPPQPATPTTTETDA